ncbi:extracellular solute-binding protein [Lachnoclostridium phytofermentans]|uniref:Extracellular solute-binding protein family 1 n=1 Tax=Lachnoclostridium phytofermentans (strain ATCC 700394 / DSM 18823 / ISDg) TaxID=357809 RepID=A9KJ93_LACP7|nr:extracellular solute-binding protein [Lachnoclostridium phytofermentans]ABX42505.1 extracellular solute-binding protein family 1 [Lachnoclostridium phytofermentans ISDg]
MKYKIIITVVLSLFVIFLVGYTTSIKNHNLKTSEEEQEELVIYSSHPLDFLKPLIEEFESRTGIFVTVVSGGTGQLIDRIEEEQDNPNADILWGGTASILKPQMYLFEEYSCANEDVIQKEFKNKEGAFTKFSDVPSVLMVNTDLIGNIKIDGYKDLLNPELKGKIAYCSPNVSSSAFEHLINMLYAMGDGNPEDGWNYVKLFCNNLDGNLLYSSTDVYRGVANGEFVVGLIFEEAAAALVANGEHIKITYMEEGVLSTPDCVTIVKNSPHLKNARAFIDFATGYEVQTMITMELNRRSVRDDVKTPTYLKAKDEIAIIHADNELIYEMKKEWIRKFEEIFLDIKEE